MMRRDFYKSIIHRIQINFISLLQIINQIDSSIESIYSCRVQIDSSQNLRDEWLRVYRGCLDMIKR